VYTLTLVNHTPPLASQDADAVAAALLRDIGYLPGGLEVPTIGADGSGRRRRGRPRRGDGPLGGLADPARPGSEVLESIPYRLAVGCLLSHPGRFYTVEQLEGELGATRPTIYRHLNKLRDLDLLAHGDGDDARGAEVAGEVTGKGAGGGRRARYGLRFGSLSRAWRFCELNAECALEGLRDRVELVWRDAQGRARKHGKGAGEKAGKGEKGGKGGKGDGGASSGDDGGASTASPAARDAPRSRLRFHLVLRELPAADPGASEDAHLRDLLLAIGYLSPGRAPEGEEDAEGSVAWRLFCECMVRRADRSWRVEELMAKLGASKPTVYRHVRKLEAMDLLERGPVGAGPGAAMGLRLRYGDLTWAWNLTEEHARASLGAYRQTVGHLERLLAEAGEGGSRG
jgi:predicted DNA-binding transcriptional regulator AlpA